MLILGIETATHQVGCAIGGHEGVITLFESSRDRRHAETLVPAIQFVMKQARIGLDEIGAVAVDVGPGLYTGLRVGVAAAKAMASALRVPMVGIPSLDLLALPLRHTNRTIVAVIDARRGELFYAFYRAVPGGVQRLTPHQVGKPDDLASELEATGQRHPPGRRRGAQVRVDLRGPPGRRARRAGAGPSVGGATRSARTLVRSAGGVRQPVGPRAGLPSPARRRDQLGDPRQPMSAARMPRESAEPLDVKIALMHRRDVRHVMPHRAAASTHAAGARECSCARSRSARPAATSRPRSAAPSSATRGCCWRPTRRTSRTSRSRPSGSDTSWRRACC